MKIEYSTRQRLMKDAGLVLLGALVILLITAAIENWCMWQWRYSPSLFSWLINYTRATNVFLLIFFLVSQWFVADEKTRMRIWTVRGFLIGLFSGIQFYVFQNGFSQLTLLNGFGRIVETFFSIAWLPFLSAFISYRLSLIKDDKSRTTYAGYVCAIVAFQYFTLLVPYRQ